MKKVEFAPRPTRNANGLTADEWIRDRHATEPTKRLTIDVPLTLHRRVKTQCAIQELVMADVIRELLDQRFPEEKGAEHAATTLSGNDPS